MQCEHTSVARTQIMRNACPRDVCH